MRRLAMLLSTMVVATALSWSPGEAQTFPGPHEDHFEVYQLPAGFSYLFPGPLKLNDQFGEVLTHDVSLAKFATPVRKNNEPMLDPIRHQTWWKLYQAQPKRIVTLENQFGPQTWQVGDAQYLVLPALKYQTGEPPLSNHYLCYDAVGPVTPMHVTLEDQFGFWSGFAVQPVVFCNPVQKTDPAGRVYPILDPEAHLACYRLDPPIPFNITVFAQDQFGGWNFVIVQNDWLCVPSFKLDVVSTEPSTWGQIKSRFD